MAAFPNPAKAGAFLSSVFAAVAKAPKPLLEPAEKPLNADPDERDGALNAEGVEGCPKAEVAGLLDPMADDRPKAGLAAEGPAGVMLEDCPNAGLAEAGVEVDGFAVAENAFGALDVPNAD